MGLCVTAWKQVETIGVCVCSYIHTAGQQMSGKCWHFWSQSVTDMRRTWPTAKGHDICNYSVCVCLCLCVCVCMWACNALRSDLVARMLGLACLNVPERAYSFWVCANVLPHCSSCCYLLKMISPFPSSEFLTLIECQQVHCIHNFCYCVVIVSRTILPGPQEKQMERVKGNRRRQCCVLLH